MTSERFSALWNKSPMIKYSVPEHLLNGMNENTVRSLTIYGLPQSAEPWLHFFEIDNPDAFLIGNGLFPVGSLANGSVICVEIALGRMLIIDHDDPEHPWLLNSSIDALYDSIMIYDQFISDVNRRNPNFSSDYRIPHGMLGELEDRLTECDPEAMEAEGFWYCELKALDDSTL